MSGAGVRDERDLPGDRIVSGVHASGLTRAARRDIYQTRRVREAALQGARGDATVAAGHARGVSTGLGSSLPTAARLPRPPRWPVVRR